MRIICESAELAVDCLRAAEIVGLKVEPQVSAAWLKAGAAELPTGPVAVALEHLPSLDELVELSQARRGGEPTLVLAILGDSPKADWIRQVALDLGITAVSEIGPLISVLCLQDAGAQAPWTAATRGLGRADRVRLEGSLTQSARSGGALLRAEGGLLAWSLDAGGPGRVLGAGRDLATAIAALRDTDHDTPQVESSVDNVDPQAVLDVLFGPRRALSDPASKAALLPYGIPLPVEELCTSPSRAASEASRIGYPVRISLASPDLRVWDHPDLAVDMVDNAAQVRDTFRQLMGLAKSRLESLGAAPASERLLGVMVTATSHAEALLGVHAWPLRGGRIAMEIAFVDPHGTAADDRTFAVLPAPLSAIERVLRRLSGHALIFRGTAAERKVRLDEISDVLLRLSAFVNDRRAEVESVEVRPLALLLDGTAEVREACVKVSDAFERTLATPAAAGAR